MVNLIYSFTFSLQGYPKGKIGIGVGFKGKTNRMPYPIEKLKPYDVKHWDKKTKRFLGGTQNDVDNNKLLEELEKSCDDLLKNPQITTPRQFIDALKSRNVPKDTFGAFLENLIAEMRNGTNNKRPSKNYQVYINLLHKLEKEDLHFSSDFNDRNIKISHFNERSHLDLF